MARDDDPAVRVFGHLTPADFVQDTSAVRSTRVDGGFDSWVDTEVHHCRARIHQDGTFEAYAVLRSAELEREFGAESDETPVHFADRLRREAKLMTATWSFAAILTPARLVDGPAPDIGANTEDKIAALARGELQLHVFWSARSPHTSRAGLLAVPGSSERDIETNVNAKTDPFRMILEP